MAMMTRSMILTVAATVVDAKPYEEKIFEGLRDATISKKNAFESRSEEDVLLVQKYEADVLKEHAALSDEDVHPAAKGWTGPPGVLLNEDNFKALGDGLDELTKNGQQKTSALYNGLQPIYGFDKETQKLQVQSQELLLRLLNPGKMKNQAPVTLGKYQTDHERRIRWMEYQIRSACRLPNVPEVRTTLNVYPEDYIMHSDSILAMVKEYCGEDKEGWNKIGLEITEYQTHSVSASDDPKFEHAPQGSLEDLAKDATWATEAIRAALKEDAGFRGYNLNGMGAELDNAAPGGMAGNVGLFNPTEKNRKLLKEAVEKLGRKGAGLYIAFDDGATGDGEPGHAFGPGQYLSSFDNLEEFLPYVDAIKFDILYLNALYRAPAFTKLKLATEDVWKMHTEKFFGFIQKMAANGCNTAILEFSAIEELASQFPAMDMGNVAATEADEEQMEKVHGKGKFVANGVIKVPAENAEGMVTEVTVLMQGGRTREWARNPLWKPLDSEMDEVARNFLAVSLGSETDTTRSGYEA